MSNRLPRVEINEDDRFILQTTYHEDGSVTQQWTDKRKQKSSTQGNPQQ